MKKLVSVILALCLLAMGTTFAAADEKIYNNGEAPELIKVTDAQGAQASAIVTDAQGNAVAVLPEGDLKIIYVGDRKEAKPEIAELMNAALANLLEDEHLANTNELVETDLFYVEIPEAYQGTMVEMVFKPLIMQDISKLLVLTTVDGTTWVEAPRVAFNGDGTVTVGMDHSCVAAFVIPHGDFASVYTEIVTADSSKVETNTNFTPSVSGKPDPEIVETVVVVTTENGEKREPASKQASIVVTPLFERVYNPDVITYEHLQWAYDTICAAPNLGGLPNVGGEGTLGDEIDRRLEGTGLNRMDMTVSDLFEVTVYGDYLSMLHDGSGTRIEVTLERNFRKDDILMVLCAIDTENWHVMDEQYVTINEDGTVTLSMEHPGVFALLVERLEADVVEGAVTAP